MKNEKSKQTAVSNTHTQTHIHRHMHVYNVCTDYASVCALQHIHADRMRSVNIDQLK